ncbi:MAG TPA: helix-turn-helix transcriptional regulator [Trinickia sp.]|uniref:helix-turn-helix domain-containing protein n=1 Tax=Trinickia sp. TaxID=2571163 RepID=UPI002B60670C|nr:helix-turn-helix transcriptional regulator [Trinickia sp.]HVW52681.1 helix-turn-helix transcriptional regulator [Trinickia sp.]
MTIGNIKHCYVAEFVTIEVVPLRCIGRDNARMVPTGGTKLSTGRPMTDARERVTLAAAEEQRRTMTTQERLYLKRIGDALARARLERRMTQDEVSEKLGVNPETISRFERGHTAPPLRRLFELATLYGVPPESLIAGGGRRSLDPEGEISSLMAKLAPADREFVRQWVSAMCLHLSKK